MKLNFIFNSVAEIFEITKNSNNFIQIVKSINKLAIINTLWFNLFYKNLY